MSDMVPSVLGEVGVPGIALEFGHTPTAQDLPVGEFNRYSSKNPSKGDQIEVIVAVLENFCDANGEAGVVTGVFSSRDITESNDAGPNGMTSSNLGSPCYGYMS